MVKPRYFNLDSPLVHIHDPEITRTDLLRTLYDRLDASGFECVGTRDACLVHRLPDQERDLDYLADHPWEVLNAELNSYEPLKWE